MIKFNGNQKKVLLGCFIAYTTAYISRLNLSPALPAISEALSINDVQAGVFQTLFAIVYAAGQLINGMIVDKVNEKVHMATGLFASAVINILFGIVHSYPVMLVLWALNGVAQSMIWTPIVKLMAIWFSDRERGKASFVMSITLVLGHLLAWAVSSVMSMVFNWHMSFVIPGVIVIALTPVALLFMAVKKDSTVAEQQKTEAGNAAQTSVMPISPLFFGTGLILILLGSVASGFIRDGVMTWGPKLLSEGVASTLSGTLGTILIIPALNCVGIIFGKLCLSRMKDAIRKTIGILMLMGAIVSALLLTQVETQNVFLLALLLGSTCALMYGMNPLLTTLVPMEYHSVGRVGLVAGLVDAFIYLGSSLAGAFTGALLESVGTRGVYIAWAAFGLLGAILLYISGKAVWQKKDSV